MSSYPSPISFPTHCTIPPHLREFIGIIANCEEDVITTGLGLARERKLRAFEGLVGRKASDVIRWVAEYHEYKGITGIILESGTRIKLMS
jgi:hypothetical protein